MRLLASSRRLWRIWRSQVRISWIREMEFRASFIMGLIRQGLWLCSFLFMISVIFSTTKTLAGWSKEEVFVILALSRFIEGIMGMLFIENIMRLPETVNKGLFDYYLTKPVPTQFYAVFRQFGVDNIGNVLGGFILLIYALFQLRFFPSPLQIGLFLLLAICGITVYYSLLILCVSLVFYLERLNGLWTFNIFFSEPLTVPFGVFPRVPRIALTYLIPIAFVVFVPAQALTGRLTWWEVPVAIGLAVIFLILANLAWRAGLRRYSSASS